MRTIEAESNDGLKFTLQVPDNATQEEILQFVHDNDDKWKNGGRYAMDPEVVESESVIGASDPEKNKAGNVAEIKRELSRRDVSPKAKQILESELAALESTPTAPKKEPSKEVPALLTRNQKADAAVEKLRGQIEEIEAEMRSLSSERFGNPGRAALLGPATTSKTQYSSLVGGLKEELRQKKEQLSKLEIQHTGETVGGTVGAAGGAATGARIGTALGTPLGQPAAGGAIGAVVGGLLGAAGGAMAGTRLWDIPEARNARVISEEEANAIAAERAGLSLIVDGAFVLVIGPTGKAVGRVMRGSPAWKSLKDSAKEMWGWDEIKDVSKNLRSDVVRDRASGAPERISGEVSRAIGEPSRVTPENIISDIEVRTGGRIPTQGEMTGVVSGGEQFIRGQAPNEFFLNERALAKAAEDIRDNTLNVLDNVGAYDDVKLGKALELITRRADQALKVRTGPIFEQAKQEGFVIDPRGLKTYLEGVVKRDNDAAGALLGVADSQQRKFVESTLARLTKMVDDDVMIGAEGAMDLVSGAKAIQRAVDVPGAQSEFLDTVMNEVVDIVDTDFQQGLKNVNPKLAYKLDRARKLYRNTKETLYSDAFARVARKDPEYFGSTLTATGSVTKIQEVRKSLNKSIDVALKVRGRGLGKATAAALAKRIDAGMIKGFLEKHTGSIGNLEKKLEDAKFKATLKELLTGKGAADPVLGRTVLNELDRTVGVLKMVKPERAPQPGVVGIPGVGGVGGGTVAGAVMGGNIQSAVISAIAFMTGMRQLSKSIAVAMTHGDTGMLREIQKVARLAGPAGKNVAAAEAIIKTAIENGWNPSEEPQEQKPVADEPVAEEPAPQPKVLRYNERGERIQ